MSGCLLGTILLTLLFLWLVTQLKVTQGKLNAYRETINPLSPPGTARPPAPWSAIGLAFLYIGMVFGIPFAMVLAWITVFMNLLSVLWAKGVNYIDDCEWHVGRAIQAFSNSPAGQENPMKEFLTKSEIIRIRQTAFGGAGFFMTWLICRNGIGEIHADKADILDEVRSGKLSGTNFLMYHCNSRITERDIAPEYLEFTNLYYSHYLVDYALWYQEHRDPDDHTYVGRWDDYLEFRNIIDENYSAYQISRGCAFEDTSIPEDSPFLVWQDDRDIAEALIVKASWLHRAALRQVEAIAELPDDEREFAFISIIQCFVKDFNILQRYNEFIDTMAREEIYDVAQELFRIAQEQCGLVMTEDAFTTAFDEYREW